MGTTNSLQLTYHNFICRFEKGVRRQKNIKPDDRRSRRDAVKNWPEEAREKLNCVGH
jgi:hypothetical protein